MSEIENAVLPYLSSHARIYQLSMMLWDTSVSFTINRHWARFIHSLIHLFIHSFHLISTAARARQASISFFSHFYLIPPAQMQKKREREVKIAFSLSLPSSLLFYTAKTVDHQQRTTFLIIDPLDNITQWKKKREKNRQVLITNHPSHHTHFFVPVPNVSAFEMYTFEVGCERFHYG